MYQPPYQTFPKVEQARRLDALASSLLSRVGCNFEVLSKDGKSYRCSRSLLEHNWPTFQSQVEELITASSALDIDESDVMILRYEPGTSMRSKSTANGGLHVSPSRLDLPLSADATRAFLFFLAAQNLVTPLQLSLDTLTEFIVFTKLQPDLVHLRSLVVHALHEVSFNFRPIPT